MDRETESGPRARCPTRATACPKRSRSELFRRFFRGATNQRKLNKLVLNLEFDLEGESK
jgi:hypothetical protein